MFNALIHKLEHLSPLDPRDLTRLTLAFQNPRVVRRRRCILEQGVNSTDVHLLVSGVAYRHKSMENGGRQILAYLLPGDLCNLRSLILAVSEYAVPALSVCMVISVPRDAILSLLESPYIARALWCASLLDEGRTREALVNLGQRTAGERTAAFLCEMHARLEAIGLVDRGTFELPVTQTDLGQTLGLSTVHVNRTLQSLRRRGLITLNRKGFTILELEALRASCGFDPTYLNLRAAPLAAAYPGVFPARTIPERGALRF